MNWELVISLSKVLGDTAGIGVATAEKKEVIPDNKVVEQRLKNLEKLKKKDLITDEEYQTKRKEILGDL